MHVVPLLFRDIETRSTARLDRCGAFRYAADLTTDVLCVGYAVDHGPVHIWTPGQPIPEEFLAAARDPDWLLVAHNDQFETAIEEQLIRPRHHWPLIPFDRHRVTMTMALASALPPALEKAATALELPFRKDRDGHRLMLQMSRPRRPRKGEDPEQVHWIDGAEQRQCLHQYCARDVELERALFHRLPSLSDFEQALWVLDAFINQRGFAIDRTLAIAARALAQHEQRAIDAEIAATHKGHITTANQVARIIAFVREHGHILQSLSKRSVSAVLAHEPGLDVRRLLELRREGSRASTRKLDSLLAGIDGDDRLRGTLRFHGAATGRWSGNRFQPQNLKKPETKDLTAAVDAVLAGDLDRVRELGAPLTVVGDISRALICAASGHVLIGADFSAIEARVLAWIAGEEWKLDAFREYDQTGALDPYCATASKILNRQVLPDDEAGRTVGKVAELAAGYGGSVGAWRRFAPEDSRPDHEIKLDIDAWRSAHPATRQFWFDLERAAKRTLFTRRCILLDRLTFELVDGTLWLTLPSGRRLAYPKARMVPGRFEGTTQIMFTDNAAGGWTNTLAWYGSFTENVVQAISRDLLAAAMLRLETAGYPIVLHVHDEIVAEVPEGFGSPEDFLRLMTTLPDWAEGLPIAAKSWTGPRYVKTKSATAAAQAVNGKKTSFVSAPSPIVIPQGPAIEADEEDEDRIAEISLADLIGESLDNGRILCPFHDDHTPSLVVYDDHFHCFVCGAHGDHVDWMMMVEGMEREQALEFLKTWDGPTIDQRELAPRDSEFNRTRALKLWETARPIAGTLAARYLAETRGIDLAQLPANVEEVLRFHPHCPFGPAAYRPCLLALMRDVRTDAPCGIHRIGLTSDAKKIDRYMMGHAGMVKVWLAGSQLVVGEGIETVLAAATRIPYRAAPLLPAWSAVSAGPLGNLPVLPGVERLIILVDYDDEGRAAAARCADRWTRAGRTVVQLMPKRLGTDFNDLVMERAS